MTKKLLIIAGAVLGLLVVVVVALPLFVNVDSFRPTLQTEMTSALGRDVQVGKLEFSWMSGGITAKDISIADDPAFSRAPFVRAKELTVGVELMPLIFSRTLHVQGLTIEGAEVTLLHNPAGKWTFSSVGSVPKPTSTSASGDF